VNNERGVATTNQPDVLLIANLKLQNVVKRLEAEVSSLKQGKMPRLE
jgi:hypothetical protein